jgi:predicted nuclease with TOPRIM domain
MDAGAIGALIPIVVLMIPVSAIVFSGLQKLAKLRIEEAKARAGSVDAGAAGEVQALRDEVTELHRELEELNERMDFTERVLAQARERDRLPGPQETRRP